MSSVFIAKGWRGEIWLDKKDGIVTATKKALDVTKIWSIHREIQILKYLNKKWCDFVPQLTHTQHDSFSYIYIEWEHYEDIYERLKNKKWKEEEVQMLLYMLLACAYKLDVLWVVHGEFLRPYKNMIVSQHDLGMYSVSVIDFERGTLQDTSGKNMRHLAQRLLTQGYVDLDLVKWLWSVSCDDIYIELQQGLRDSKDWSL